MFDNANRSLYLETLYTKLREEFPSVFVGLPANVLITVSYPSTGARGNPSKRNPAEVNFQWQGNANEDCFIAVHPASMKSPLETAKAVAFAAAKYRGGARWGAIRAGITKNADGTLSATPDTQARLEKVIADCGEAPAGYGVPHPVRTVQRTRNRLYVADKDFCADNKTKHPKVRAASDVLDVACQVCQSKYKLVP